MTLKAEVDGDLVESLVDLAELFNSLNLAIRRETSARAGQTALSNEEVAFLGHVMANADATLDGIVASTGYRPAVLAQCARTLAKRGLVSVEPGAGSLPSRYRVTADGVALRATARERAAHHLRYAISGITARDRVDLERAGHALVALASALGFHDLHPAYVGVIPAPR